MKKVIIVGLHFLYWIVYTYVLALFMWMTATSQGFKLSNEMFVRVWQLSFYIPGLIAFYSCYTFLFSKFLMKKRILALLIYSFSVFVISALITVFFLFLYISPTPGFEKMGLTSAFGMVVVTFIIAMINGIMGFILRGFITWYRDIKVKEELNKKNYEMELALMKAQINPHFLFNTINNIDVLIQKDAIKASEYLNKLSDIMRFMLYETKTEKITLAKEMSYIEKYIELQRIRTTNPNYVKYEVEGSTDSLLIEPMLFIPFIENAFKHSENKKVENAIKIRFVIEKDKIKFECENVYSTDVQMKPEHSGLGNELIQRRLVLLYPNKHTFDVVNKNGVYKVNLLLSL